MNIFQAIILGIVQGATEFLPVSSSGHLVLMQTMFGMDPQQMLFFDVCLHLGTLVAVVSVYYKMIWQLIKRIISKPVLMLVIATLFTVAIVLLGEKIMHLALSGKFLGFGFLITSAMLFLSTKVRKRKARMEGVTLFQAVSVGIVQGISALIPGMSRSGSTITTALFTGVSRRAAADFSFLLSIPAILGSLVFTLPDVIQNGLVGTDWTCVIVGGIFAALTGFLAIKILLELIVNGRIKGFAIYTLILGALVLLDQYALHLFFK